MDIKNLANEILFSAPVDSIKELVITAIKAKVDLYGANLRGANLYGADLYGANLYGAEKIPDLVSAETKIIPEEGAFVGWKICKDGVVVKLLIPAEARRSNGTERTCRAEFVEVLEVIGAEVGYSTYDNSVEYRKGKTIRADKWDDDRWNTCSHGIHFFLTRLEAENY